MEKSENTLTFILIIGVLGYLFFNNYLNTNSDCESKQSFNWSEKTEENRTNTIKCDSDTEINIDSMLTIVVEELESDSTIKNAIDSITIIKTEDKE